VPDLLYTYPDGIAYRSIDVVNWLTEDEFEELVDDALDDYVEDEVPSAREGM